MSVLAKAGTFNSPTSTGNQQVSTGFQPKLVILYTTFQTAAGTAANSLIAIGAATSSSQRTCSSAWSDDNDTDSDCRATTSVTRCLRFENTVPTTLLSADFVSMDTGGFTVNWVTVDASARIVGYLAIGGDISAWVGQIDSPTSTGNVGYTGVGFLPTALLLVKPHGQGTTGTAGGGVTVAPAFGFAKSSTERACMAVIDRHGQTAADSARYQRADKCYTVLSNTSTVMIEADFVSFDSDGFTLNWTTANASARKVIAIALAGVTCKVATFSQKTSTGAQSVTGVGFTPKAVILAGWSNVADSGTVLADMNAFFGWATGASDENSFWAGSDDAADPTACDSAISTSSCIQMRTAGTAALLAEANLTGFSSGQFDLDWTTADATARQIIYMALGEPGGGQPAGSWVKWAGAGGAVPAVPPGVQSTLIAGLTAGVSYDVRARPIDNSGNLNAGNTPAAATPTAATSNPFIRRPLQDPPRPGRPPWLVPP